MLVKSMTSSIFSRNAYVGSTNCCQATSAGTTNMPKLKKLAFDLTRNTSVTIR